MSQKTGGNVRTLIAAMRLIHIFGGVVWAGWVFSQVAFVIPALRIAGPEGGKFMQILAGRTRLSMTMSLSSALVVLTGIAMYGHVSGGLDGDWLSSAPGIAVTIGSLAGIAAFLIGLVVNRPTAARMSALGAQISARTGAPTPEELAELHSCQQRLAKASRVVAALLVIAVVSMAIERSLY